MGVKCRSRRNRPRDIFVVVGKQTPESQYNLPDEIDLCASCPERRRYVDPIDDQVEAYAQRPNPSP